MFNLTNTTFISASDDWETVTTTGLAWSSFDPLNGVQGLTVHGAAHATRTYDCSEAGCKSFFLALEMSGTFLGNIDVIPGPVPVKWIFHGQRDDDPEKAFDWDLSWMARDDMNNLLASYAVASGTATGNDTITGDSNLHFNIPMGAGRNLGTWYMSLAISGSFPAGTKLMLDVGPASLDINPYHVQNNGGDVPEPSTLLLMLGGLAGLVSSRRRR